MKSLRKALNIIESFLYNERLLSLTELSKITGYNISTIHGIISVLVENGYLKQNGKRGKYSLGFKFIEFGFHIKSNVEILSVAQPYMEKLSRLVSDSVSLAIRDNNKAVILEILNLRKEGLIVTRTSESKMTLYASGVGKALLAYEPKEYQDRYIASTKLIPLTTNTITNAIQLKKQLSQIVRNGYAIDNQETALGVIDIAAPILGKDGYVIAALGIIGPSVRLTEDRISELSKAVKGCAMEISKAISF